MKMETDIIGMKGNSNLELPYFALGILGGIVLGLLFAPQSGRVARRLISRKVQHGEDYVTSTAEGLRDKAEEIAEVIARPL